MTYLRLASLATINCLERSKVLGADGVMMDFLQFIYFWFRWDEVCFKVLERESQIV